MMIDPIGKFTEWLSSYNRFRRSLRAWRRLKLRAGKAELHSGRVLIIPADPWSLIGSRGDEAMLVAVTTQLRSRFAGLEFGVLTASDTASDAARLLGLEPFQIWHSSLEAIFSFVHGYGPAAVVVIGADCMDGYYNPHTTLTFLALADLAVCSGMRATLTGFSFNEAPNAWLRKPFNSMSDGVRVNVRDKVSLARFNEFCSVRAQLVSDCAFMLRGVSESVPVQALGGWVQARREGQQKVLGFNIHPMLVKHGDMAAVGKIVDACCTALANYLSTSSVSLVVLPHDYRDGGDDVCLGPIFDHLIALYPDRVYYEKVHVSAAELKAMAGTLDGVVTGRMHLAIAALGMGVPVAAFAYQGKFEGMLQHFGLDSDLVMRPEYLMDDVRLLEFLVGFEKKIPIVRGAVQGALADVVALSQLNVDGILQEYT